MKWPPQYRTNSTLSDFNDISYVGRLWCPEFNPDIEKFLLPVAILRCRESIQDIIIYPHMKCRWNRTMLNLCSIVVAILKMATDRNFSISGINLGYHNLNNFYRSPFSKWPPIYRTNSTLSDFNDIWYVGRLWCPKLIPEIEKFC
jgi:hypothetical protein